MIQRKTLETTLSQLKDSVEAIFDGVQNKRPKDFPFTQGGAPSVEGLRDFIERNVEFLRQTLDQDVVKESKTSLSSFEEAISLAETFLSVERSAVALRLTRFGTSLESVKVEYGDAEDVTLTCSATGKAAKVGELPLEGAFPEDGPFHVTLSTQSGVFGSVTLESEGTTDMLTYII
jgi:hypothetical protein